MPTSRDALQRALEMQRLCNAVEDDVEALRSFDARLADIDARYRQLSELYQRDWQALQEGESLDDAQRAALDAAVPEGRSSILWQDTI